MILRPLNRAEVRSLDRLAADHYHLPTLVLMENAGRAAAAWLRSRLRPEASVLIACGPGNNGGDGGVVARHLDAWGFKTRVVWFADRARIIGDAAVQHEILARSGIDQTHWLATTCEGVDPLCRDADWLVDGLLGTGLTRPVEGLLAGVIAAMNQSGRPILALDLPSGLDTDTGEPLGVAIRATATVTFVACKVGFASEAAAPYLGEVHVADIGLPRKLLEPFAIQDEG